MLNRGCKSCKKLSTDVELRGVKYKDIPNGLYCEPCFIIGEPGKAYLSWEHAMPLPEYISFENRWMKGSL